MIRVICIGEEEDGSNEARVGQPRFVGKHNKISSLTKKGLGGVRLQRAGGEGGLGGAMLVRVRLTWTSARKMGWEGRRWLGVRACVLEG